MSSNKEILDVLLRSKELLSDKDKWTKGYAARDAEGNATGFDADESHSYCMMGAIAKVTHDMKNEIPSDNFNKLRTDCYMELDAAINLITDFVGIARFNDHELTKHKEVIGVLDFMIRQKMEKDA